MALPARPLPGAVFLLRIVLLVPVFSRKRNTLLRMREKGSILEKRDTRSDLHERDQLRPRGASAAIGPYSHAVAAGGLLFTSGQIALVPETGALAGDTIEEQTEQVLKNLEAVLAAHQMTFADVVKNDGVF